MSPFRCSALVLVLLLSASPLVAQAESESRLASLLATIEGDAAVRRSDWAGALEAFTRALEQDPENIAAQFGAGRAAVMEGHLDQAIGHFQSIGAPVRAEAMYWKGLAEAAAGRGEAALESFGISLSLDHRPAWNARIYPKAPQASHEERSTVHWAMAASDRSADVLPSFMYANSLAASERFEEALAQFQHALELVPDSMHLRLCVAITLLELGRNVQAEELVANILREDPNHQFALWIQAILGIREANEAEFQTNQYLASIREEKTDWEEFLAFRDKQRARLGTAVPFYSRMLERQEIEELDLDEVLRRSAREAVRAGDIETSIALANRYALFGGEGSYDDIFGVDDTDNKLEVYRDWPPRTPVDHFHYVALLRRGNALPGEMEKGLAGLRGVLQAHPNFAAGKLLLAELVGNREEDAERTRLLEELLREHPKAVRPRLMLISRQPLDLALRTVSEMPEQAQARRDVIAVRAKLAYRAGANEEALRLAVDGLRARPGIDSQGLVTRRDPAGWYLQLAEVLSLVLKDRGDFEGSLLILEYLRPLHRVDRTVLERARLREELGRPNVIEGWIDTWRRLPGAGRSEASAALQRYDTSQYRCGGCGGTGTVETPMVTSRGLMPLGGGLYQEETKTSMVNQACGACFGLGLVHEGAL